MIKPSDLIIYLIHAVFFAMLYGVFAYLKDDNSRIKKISAKFNKVKTFVSSKQKSEKNNMLYITTTVQTNAVRHQTYLAKRIP